VLTAQGGAAPAARLLVTDVGCDTPGGCQRWNFNAKINARDLNGYYASPFVAAISAGAPA
jgi:hypothetical protein